MKIDKKRLFAMSIDEFDDSPEGWRSLADGTKEGRLRCARTIEEYLEEFDHELTQKVAEDKAHLWFHAGQCWAGAGKDYYDLALRCFEMSTKNWHSEAARLYRVATVAFMKKDEESIRLSLSELNKIEGAWNLSLLCEYMLSHLATSKTVDYNDMYSDFSEEWEKRVTADSSGKLR